MGGIHANKRENTCTYLFYLMHRRLLAHHASINPAPLIIIENESEYLS